MFDCLSPSRMARSVPLALLALCLAVPFSASALGLGKIQMFSSSGQPLHAEVEVLAVSPKDRRDAVVKNASAEEYASQGVDARGPLASLTVVIEQRGDRTLAVLTTPEALTDLSTTIILVSAAPGGRVMRTYTVALDVPALREGPASFSASSTIGEQLKLIAAEEDRAATLRRSLGSALQAPGKLGVTEVGRRPPAKTIPRASATGRAVSLSAALNRILPRGWTRDFTAAGDLTSETAGPPVRPAPWPSVLERLTAEKGLMATIDWQHKTVTVHR